MRSAPSPIDVLNLHLIDGTLCRLFNFICHSNTVSEPKLISVDFLDFPAGLSKKQLDDKVHASVFCLIPRKDAKEN